MRKPLVYLDFETTPMLVETYTFYENTPIRIRQHVKILSVSWSWEGEKEIYHLALPDFEGHKAGLENVDDYQLVKAFAEVIAKAESVAAHNGNGFDFRLWRTRLLKHGLDPMHHVKEIDTKQWAKKFYFANNKQDNISDELGTQRKLEHSKNMHYKCYELNDPKAWAENKKYNNWDVKGLKENAHKLAPHVPHKTAYKERICRNELCRSDNLHRSKIWQVKNGWKIQYQCAVCKSYTTAGQIYEEKPILTRNVS